MKFFSALFILCCMSTPRIAAGSLNISLDNFDRIGLKSSTKTTEQTIGKPTDIKPVADSKNLSAWVYFDKNKIDRATFIFDKATGMLLAKTWRIENGDPEKDISTAMKHYPDAHFKIRNAPWSSDFLPDEAYYEDAARGISIKFRKKRKEALSISWSLPEARR